MKSTYVNESGSSHLGSVSPILLKPNPDFNNLIEAVEDPNFLLKPPPIIDKPGPVNQPNPTLKIEKSQTEEIPKKEPAMAFNFEKYKKPILIGTGTALGLIVLKTLF